MFWGIQFVSCPFFLAFRGTTVELPISLAPFISGATDWVPQEPEGFTVIFVAAKGVTAAVSFGI